LSTVITNLFLFRLYTNAVITRRPATHHSGHHRATPKNRLTFRGPDDIDQLSVRWS